MQDQVRATTSACDAVSRYENAPDVRHEGPDVRESRAKERQRDDVTWDIVLVHSIEKQRESGSPGPGGMRDEHPGDKRG